MPRTCTVCAHPEREALDRALVAGATYRDIAGRYGLTWLTDPDDPERYDLGPRAREVMVTYEARRGGDRAPVRRKAWLADLLARVDGHATAGLVTMVEHKSADPRRLIIDATARLDGHLRLLGELVGKLQAQGTVNVIVSPEWRALRSRLLVALAPYPDARYALAAAIEAEVADADAGG